MLLVVQGPSTRAEAACSTRQPTALLSIRRTEPAAARPSATARARLQPRPGPRTIGSAARREPARPRLRPTLPAAVPARAAARRTAPASAMRARRFRQDPTRVHGMEPCAATGPISRRVQRELYASSSPTSPSNPTCARSLARSAPESSTTGSSPEGRCAAPEAYTATTPPHVAVARKLGRRRGLIPYVITTSGPNLPSRTRSLRLRAYLDRQVRAVAERARAARLDLERCPGRGQQLRLF